MIKEAIEKIVQLASSAQVVVDGREYWDKTGQAIRPPTVNPIAEVVSLTAIISAFDSPELAGGAESGKIQIVVDGPHQVRVIGIADCKWAKRDHYMTAKCVVESFPFNRFLEIEDFIINVQCLFEESEKKCALLRYVSSITGSEVVSKADDGISQTVVVENSIGRKDKGTINPMISLVPYRTFPEAIQPNSLFLLRLRKNNDNFPIVALFETDGGMWISRACENVAKYLRCALPNVKVIG